MSTLSTEVGQEPPAKRKYTKKAKDPAEKKKRKARTLPANTFLFFIVKKDEYTIPVPADMADLKALEIFMNPDFKGVKEIFFMRPIKVYGKPTLNITKCK